MQFFSDAENFTILVFFEFGAVGAVQVQFIRHEDFLISVEFGAVGAVQVQLVQFIRHEDFLISVEFGAVGAVPGAVQKSKNTQLTPKISVSQLSFGAVGAVGAVNFSNLIKLIFEF